MKDKTEKLVNAVVGESSPPTTLLGSKHIQHYQNEQHAIIRQSCLKSAAEIIKGFNYENEEAAQEALIKMAQGLVDWVKLAQ